MKQVANWPVVIGLTTVVSCLSVRCQRSNALLFQGWSTFLDHPITYILKVTTTMVMMMSRITEGIRLGLRAFALCPSCQHRLVVEINAKLVLSNYLLFLVLLTTRLTGWLE